MSWKTVHANLSRLARDKAALDAEEARWLVRAARARVHVHLGYGSLAEYLERLFGYGPRLAHERLRVAEALEALPSMRERLAAADLSWSAVRELSRVATPETEAGWIEAAAGKTVREVERMVSGRKPGDRPTSPADPAAMTTVLRLEISADTLAAFREARAQCTREVGHRIGDDALVRMIVERALSAGHRDDGRSPYQVKIAVCPECGRGARAAAGELHPMAPARLEQALCDAQRFVDGGAAAVRGDSPARATQTIPPRVRRSVLRRDGGCVVPGCRNSVFREIHHVIRRADGGGHDAEKLAELCSAHHAQVHAGRLRIRGTFSDGFRVEHADGRPYGTAPLAAPPTWAASAEPERTNLAAATDAALRSPRTTPATADRAPRADALLALRQLGFGDREARRALAGAQGDTLEAILRAALVALGRCVAVRTRPGERAGEPALRWSGPALAAAAPA